MKKSLIPFPGNKAGLAAETANYLPQCYFEETWESNAGTLAFSANVLNHMNMKAVHASELDIGMYNLLTQVQENPRELIAALWETEYDEEVFSGALYASENDFAGMTPLEIAMAQYEMCVMSINGMGTDYRDIDNDFENGIAGVKNKRWFREKYKRRILSLYDYSKLIQGIQIRNEDMLNSFDHFASHRDCFIYSDIPYDNALRSTGLYKQETNERWHDEFSQKLADMTRNGSLQAQMMLCGYVNTDLSKDRYCRALLPEGWTLYMIKDVYRPTIIRENTKDKKHKGKGIECVFLNYEPINPKVGRDRIFRYADVF